MGPTMARLTWPRVRTSSTLKMPLTSLLDPVLLRRRHHKLNLSKDYPLFYDIDIDSCFSSL